MKNMMNIIADALVGIKGGQDMELKQLKDLVTETLKQGETFRENDDELYFAVCVKVNSRISDRLLTNMTVSEFFGNRKKYGLPTFESVSRCRRKAQEEHPELRPRKKVQEARKTKQDEFYKWSQLKQQSFDF
jgi:hypothetical protein